MLSKLPSLQTPNATRNVATRRLRWASPIVAVASLAAVAVGFPTQAEAKPAYVSSNVAMAEPVAIHDAPIGKAKDGVEDGRIDTSSELGRRRANVTTRVDGHEVTVQMDLPTGPFAFNVGIPVTVYAQSRTGTPSLPIKICSDPNCDVILAEATVTATKAHALSDVPESAQQTFVVHHNDANIHLHLPGNVQSDYPYRHLFVTRTSAEWVVATEGPSMDVVSAGRIPDSNGGSHGFAGIRGVTFYNMFEKHPELVHGFHAIVFHPSTKVSPALQAELSTFVKRGGVVIAGEHLIPGHHDSFLKWEAIASPGDLRKYSSNVTIPAANLDAAAMLKDEDGVWIRHSYAGLDAEQTTSALLSVRPEFSLGRSSVVPSNGPAKVAARIAVHRFNSAAVTVVFGLLWLIAAFAALMSVRKRRWTTVLVTLGAMSFATTVLAFLGASFWRTSSDSISVKVDERIIGRTTSVETGVSAQRTGMWGREATLQTPPGVHVALEKETANGRLTKVAVREEETVARAEHANIVFASWQTKRVREAALQVVDVERDRENNQGVPVVKNTSTSTLHFVGLSGPNGTRWVRRLEAGESVSYNDLHHSKRGNYALDNLRDDSDRSTLPARRLVRELSRHCDNSRGRSFDNYSCAVAANMNGNALTGHLVYGFGTEGGTK